jgi:hypothetical protein
MHPRIPDVWPALPSRSTRGSIARATTRIFGIGETPTATECFGACGCDDCASAAPPASAGPERARSRPDSSWAPIGRPALARPSSQGSEAERGPTDRNVLTRTATAAAPSVHAIGKTSPAVHEPSRGARQTVAKPDSQTYGCSGVDSVHAGVRPIQRPSAHVAPSVRLPDNPDFKTPAPWNGGRPRRGGAKYSSAAPTVNTVAGGAALLAPADASLEWGCGPKVARCPGPSLSTDEETALAARSTDGQDAYIGRPLTGPSECGWTYGGYALPLLEDPANAVWWSALGQLTPWAGGSLGYHVSVTSTSTVLLRNATSSRSYACAYRMYFQSPKLVSNTRDRVFNASQPVPHNVNDAYVDDEESWALDYPAYYLWDTYEEDASRDRECFNVDYLSFVDSLDGGLTFPVWGPRAYMPSVDSSSGRYSSFAWDWDNAGWKQTAFRTRYAATPDADGFYARYQDATVLDLFNEIGYFVLIAVECRSDVPPSDSRIEDEEETVGQCGCVNSCEGTCSFATASSGMPYTRLVVFFPKNPDFPEDEVIPFPNSSPHALVLLSPDEGAGGPGVGECTNEWYGVPHALVTPDRSSVLVYVPWQGHGESVDSWPSRVRARYPEGTYAAQNESGLVIESPRWQLFPNGISCFQLSVATLAGIASMLSARESLARMVGSHATPGAEEMLLWMARVVGYRGEVLISDGGIGSLDSPDGATTWDHPLQVGGITDPQFVYIGGDLWVYWDSYPKGLTAGSTVQLRRAKLASVSELEAREGGDFVNALGQNDEYTLFLTPESCDVEFDLRCLSQPEGATYPSSNPAEWGDPGGLLADPDVVVISDGRLRVSFFGGTPRGLQVAFTDVPATCR